MRHRPPYELRAYVNQYICKLFFLCFFSARPSEARTPFYIVYLCLSFFDYRTYTTRAIVTFVCFVYLLFNFLIMVHVRGARAGALGIPPSLAGISSTIVSYLLYFRFVASCLPRIASLELRSDSSPFDCYRFFYRACDQLDKKATLGARQDAPVRNRRL